MGKIKDVKIVEVKDLVPIEFVEDQGIVEQAKSMVIQDQSSYDLGNIIGKGYMETIKTIKDYFKDKKAAAKLNHTHWCTAEKDSLKPYEEARVIINTALINYETEQERIRLVEEKRLQDEFDAKQKKEREELEKQAEEMGYSPEEVEMANDSYEELHPLATDIHVASTVVKSGSTRANWKWELLDLKQIVAYCVENNRYDLLDIHNVNMNI